MKKIKKILVEQLKVADVLTPIIFYFFTLCGIFIYRFMYDIAVFLIINAIKKSINLKWMLIK